MYMQQLTFFPEHVYPTWDNPVSKHLRFLQNLQSWVEHYQYSHMVEEHPSWNKPVDLDI